MLVVHLVSSAQLGGTEAVVAEMVASLRAAHPDWRLRVVCPERGPFVERLEASGTAVQVLEFPARLAALGEAGHMTSRFGAAGMLGRLLLSVPAVLGYRRALRTLLSAAAPEPIAVVHAHGFKMQVLGALSCPPPATLVWHLHDYLASRRMSTRILGRLARRCDVVIANSASVAQDARRALGGVVRVATVYNAVDLGRFRPDGPALDLDAAAGVPPPEQPVVRVGLPAAFGRWKGHRVFLRALARLSDLPLRAYIIGGPLYRTAGSQETLDSLRGLAAELHLDGRVLFTGPLADVAPAMRALDIVVHASTDPEPFGMVIAEAMASARAVIVSGAGGAAELVRDGLDGLVHRPGDAGDLARQIRVLAADPALRGRLGAAARVSAEARFDRTRLGIEIAPLYGAPAAA